MTESNERTISEVTRRAIFDELSDSGVAWYGRFDEIAFLKRLFDLENMPSKDGRRDNAEGDIWQHTVNNSDWEAGWIIEDDRFGILTESDEAFLRFVVALVDPVVRSDTSEAKKLVERFNRHLRADGWELRKSGEMSGRSLYTAKQIERASLSAAEKGFPVDVDDLLGSMFRLLKAARADVEIRVLAASRARAFQSNYDQLERWHLRMEHRTCRKAGGLRFPRRGFSKEGCRASARNGAPFLHRVSKRQS